MAKSYQLWSIVLMKIVYAPLANIIVAKGNPQAACREFENYYHVRAHTAKRHAKADWQGLKQTDAGSSSTRCPCRLGCILLDP